METFCTFAREHDIVERVGTAFTSGRFTELTFCAQIVVLLESPLIAPVAKR
jgi:hypothetical protein